MAYLDDHPPRRSQFRCPRRSTLSGVIVVHTAENSPDWSPPDTGAEAVAKFIVGRPDPGSYHDLVDSDTVVNLVRYDCEAFHDGTGSNPHSLGLSFATTAARWPTMPEAWTVAAIRNGARAAATMAAHVKARTGIVIPPRRITRAQSEARVPGFISHAERDPGRRSDPGARFPWALFLAEYARLTSAGEPEPDQSVEDDDMIPVIGVQGDTTRYYAALCDGYVRVFYQWPPEGLDAQTVWAPNEELERGTGVLYKSLRWVDARTYDTLVASAKRTAYPVGR